MRGLNNKVVSSQNSLLLLHLILSEEGISRTELSNRSGLTKMTVTNIINEYLKSDWIVESKPSQSEKQGRPIGSLFISDGAPKFIVAEISEKQIAFGLSDIKGNNSFRQVKEYEETESSFLETLYSGIDAILRLAISKRIKGICVSFDGDVDPISGDLNKANHPFFKDYNLVTKLKQRYNIEVYTSNSIDNIAVFERYFGLGRDEDSFLYIHIDSEVTSCLYINGKTRIVNSNSGTNIGHLSIDYNGLSCGCGNRGCLQSYISTSSMEKKLRDITKLKSDFKGFCEMQSKKNDARIDWAFKDMMDKLGFAIISFLSLLPVSKIIIGGSGSLIPDRYLSKLDKTIESKRIDRQSKTELLKLQAKPSGISTAVAPVLQRMFEDNIEFL